MNNYQEDTVLTKANEAGRAIPPLWPLASSVAVNPFLGQTHLNLAQTAAYLERIAGAQVTMHREWYARKIDDGTITDDDIAKALELINDPHLRLDIAAVKTSAQRLAPQPRVLPTVADLAASLSQMDWPEFIGDRIGAWAASHFDEGQAIWAAPKARDAFSAWRSYATHDMTPQISGLSGFSAVAAATPETASDAIKRSTTVLGVSAEALGPYFLRLLMTLGGWSQFARFKLWQAERFGRHDPTMIDLLAVRLVWEEALLNHYGPGLFKQWRHTCALYEEPFVPSRDHVIDSILQEAAERSSQRKLSTQLAQPSSDSKADARPMVQMAFCIDVRSEVFRRALESIDQSIVTLGFAGFFGLATSYRGFASDVEELRLPVLLKPILSSCSSETDTPKDMAARITARASRAWTRFKLAAVSSFAFVEAVGPVYFMKLVRDTLRSAHFPSENEPKPLFIDAEDNTTRKTDIAARILRAMSLTDGFARLVVIVGHGASVKNNPHASALNCGACGGYAGDVNARLLATLFNEEPVRLGLSERGIHIPEDTLFMAALHDTTTDTVTLYEEDGSSVSHASDIAKTRSALFVAGKIARAERALRLPRATSDKGIASRSRDWSEIRPEWGLAGCSAFIAAPRALTKGKSLEGRAFLHDYDWKNDSDFSVLELIMTAPVVVASWISLQYYGSTVAPHIFGSGNKLLHNVVGGIGVLEGNGGTLRSGLPWQSIHDGQKYIHDPLRLTVCIAAPRKAIDAILERHDHVRALFDNKWLHLFALHAAGHLAWRYTGNLSWKPESEVPTVAANLEVAI